MADVLPFAWEHPMCLPSLGSTAHALHEKVLLDTWRGNRTFGTMERLVLDPATISEIIEMALSDHATFDQIRALHGLGPDEVKALMRQNLKPGSYRAWRRRVRQFADRREVYK